MHLVFSSHSSPLLICIGLRAAGRLIRHVYAVAAVGTRATIVYIPP